MSQGYPSAIGLGSFASLCENIVSTDAQRALSANPAYARSLSAHPARARIFAQLDQRDFDELVSEACRDRIGEKLRRVASGVKRRLKALLKR